MFCVVCVLFCGVPAQVGTTCHHADHHHVKYACCCGVNCPQLALTTACCCGVNAHNETLVVGALDTGVVIVHHLGVTGVGVHAQGVGVHAQGVVIVHHLGVTGVGVGVVVVFVGVPDVDEAIQAGCVTVAGALDTGAGAL